MVLAIAIAFLLCRPSQQYNETMCPKYDLFLEQVYPFDEDLSNECLANECVILASNILVNDQQYNNWCYQNKTSYVGSTRCSNFTNWSAYKDKQFKFSCRGPNEICSLSEKSCIPDWLEYCKYNDSSDYACPVYHISNATTDTPTTTTSDETISSLTSKSTSSEATSPPTTTETSTAAPFCEQASCPSGECFFGDHCYFISPMFGGRL